MIQSFKLRAPEDIITEDELELALESPAILDRVKLSRMSARLELTGPVATAGRVTREVHPGLMMTRKQALEDQLRVHEDKLADTWRRIAERNEALREERREARRFHWWSDSWDADRQVAKDKTETRLAKARLEIGPPKQRVRSIAFLSGRRTKLLHKLVVARRTARIEAEKENGNVAGLEAEHMALLAEIGMIDEQIKEHPRTKASRMMLPLPSLTGALDEKKAPFIPDFK